MIDMDNPQRTIDCINLDGLNDSQLELVKKLSTPKLYGVKPTDESIMTCGKVCSCDDGFLCEHRLQEIVNWMKK